jgi:prephenate dehydrogenase
MIGIIGFGRFGKLMTRYLAEDCQVLVYDKNGDVEGIESRGGVASTLPDVCRQPTIVLAVPISSVQQVLDQIHGQLTPGSLVIDVCSVKILPMAWMVKLLPAGVDILGTHPMFGPDSASDSLTGGKIVLCRQRLSDERYDRVRNYLLSKGLVVIETTPDEHDREISVSLALTHTIGRALAQFGATPQQIDTEGYKRLLHILEVVQNDTWQLFEDMNRYNPYASAKRKAFIEALQGISAGLPETPNLV